MQLLSCTTTSSLTVLISLHTVYYFFIMTATIGNLRPVSALESMYYRKRGGGMMVADNDEIPLINDDQEDGGRIIRRLMMNAQNPFLEVFGKRSPPVIDVDVVGSTVPQFSAALYPLSSHDNLPFIRLRKRRQQVLPKENRMFMLPNTNRRERRSYPIMIHRVFRLSKRGQAAAPPPPTWRDLGGTNGDASLSSYDEQFERYGRNPFLQRFG